VRSHLYSIVYIPDRGNHEDERSTLGVVFNGEPKGLEEFFLLKSLLVCKVLLGHTISTVSEVELFGGFFGFFGSVKLEVHGHFEISFVGWFRL